MGNYGGPSPGDTVVTGVALAVKCSPHAAQTFAKNHHGDIVAEHPERPTTYGQLKSRRWRTVCLEIIFGAAEAFLLHDQWFLELRQQALR